MVSGSMCDYRAKKKSQLSKHIANKHDIAVAILAKQAEIEDTNGVTS